MKLLSIVGARPQFVKLAPFARAVRHEYTHVIVHTGQHYDHGMSGLFFEQLEIPEPDINLNIGSGDHGAQTGRMLEQIERTLKNEEPDCVVVFGDTNSTLAGALAAVKLHIAVVHIEAGLRSFNRIMPEEINRVLADHTADYLFAPTATAMKNLANEGLADRSYRTGDIMVDALLENRVRAEKMADNARNFVPDDDPYYLVTLHRPYNVDNPRQLQLILRVLANNGQNVIFPVHPRTQTVIDKHNIKVPENITTIPPLGYLDFIYLESHAEKIITDSGGIQKEAYILEKPCITLRPETEWVETVDCGWNLLLDPSSDISPGAIAQFKPPAEHPPIFGENVAEEMVSVLGNVLDD